MSVLVRDCRSEELFVFAKGAPELLHSYSAKKCLSFEKILRDLSLSGYRTIGLSFKRVENHQVKKYLDWDRRQFM